MINCSTYRITNYRLFIRLLFIRFCRKFYQNSHDHFIQFLLIFISLILFYCFSKSQNILVQDYTFCSLMKQNTTGSFPQYCKDNIFSLHGFISVLCSKTLVWGSPTKLRGSQQITALSFARLFNKDSKTETQGISKKSGLEVRSNK